MPGRPKRRAAIAKVEARGGATFLEEYLLSGGTITGLARELDLDRGFLQRLVNNHDDYKRAMEAAREQGADAHAEAVEVVVVLAHRLFRLFLIFAHLPIQLYRHAAHPLRGRSVARIHLHERRRVAAS